MFTRFTKEEKTIHYPTDRRMFIAIKPYMWIWLAVIISVPIGLAWLQYLLIGLPVDPPFSISNITPADPTGFPLWLILNHWFNFFFMVMIIRSGLSILVCLLYTSDAADE